MEVGGGDVVEALVCNLRPIRRHPRLVVPALAGLPADQKEEAGRDVRYEQPKEDDDEHADDVAAREDGKAAHESANAHEANRLDEGDGRELIDHAVPRDRGDEVEEEPGAQVAHGDHAHAHDGVAALLVPVEELQRDVKDEDYVEEDLGAVAQHGDLEREVERRRDRRRHDRARHEHVEHRLLRVARMDDEGIQTFPQTSLGRPCPIGSLQLQQLRFADPAVVEADPVVLELVTHDALQPVPHPCLSAVLLLLWQWEHLRRHALDRRDALGTREGRAGLRPLRRAALRPFRPFRPCRHGADGSRDGSARRLGG